MPTLELPVSHPGTSPRDALLRMAEEGKSGLLVSCRPGIRLIEYNAVLEAFDQGRTTVGNIRGVKVISAKKHPIGRRPVRGYAAVRRGAGRNVNRFLGFTKRPGGQARVFISNGALVDLYLSGPPATKCSNSPPEKHYYPPNKRDPADPHQCVLCAGTLP